MTQMKEKLAHIRELEEKIVEQDMTIETAKSQLEKAYETMNLYEKRLFGFEAEEAEY